MARLKAKMKAGGHPKMCTHPIQFQHHNFCGAPVEATAQIYKDTDTCADIRAKRIVRFLQKRIKT